MFRVFLYQKYLNVNHTDIDFSVRFFRFLNFNSIPIFGCIISILWIKSQNFQYISAKMCIILLCFFSVFINKQNKKHAFTVRCSHNVRVRVCVLCFYIPILLLFNRCFSQNIILKIPYRAIYTKTKTIFNLYFTLNTQIMNNYLFYSIQKTQPLTWLMFTG